MAKGKWDDILVPFNGDIVAYLLHQVETTKLGIYTCQIDTRVPDYLRLINVLSIAKYPFEIRFNLKKGDCAAKFFIVPKNKRAKPKRKPLEPKITYTKEK